MISVTCECGKVLRTKDEYAGKKAACPKCGAAVRLPELAAVAAAAPPSVEFKTVDEPAEPDPEPYRFATDPEPESFESDDFGTDDDELEALPPAVNRRSGPNAAAAVISSSIAPVYTYRNLAFVLGFGEAIVNVYCVLWGLLLLGPLGVACLMAYGLHIVAAIAVALLGLPLIAGFVLLMRAFGLASLEFVRVIMNIEHNTRRAAA